MGERILQQNLELRQGRFGAGEPEGTQQGRAQRRIVGLFEPGLEVLRERKLRQRAPQRPKVRPVPRGCAPIDQAGHAARERQAALPPRRRRRQKCERHLQAGVGLPETPEPVDRGDHARIAQGDRARGRRILDLAEIERAGRQGGVVVGDLQEQGFARTQPGPGDGGQRLDLFKEPGPMSIRRSVQD